jgi:predicted benzoate:H+ symporter BenE
VILTGGLRPGEVVAAGIMIGVFLLVLGITGWIGRLARAIPQSVSAGLQLGLGLLMAMLGLKLILETPWLGFGSFALLFALTRIPSCPTAPIALAAAMFAGWATGKVGIASWAAITPGTPQLLVPSWPEVWHSFEIAVLPQLSLIRRDAPPRARCAESRHSSSREQRGARDHPG